MTHNSGNNTPQDPYSYEDETTTFEAVDSYPPVEEPASRSGVNGLLIGILLALIVVVALLLAFLLGPFGSTDHEDPVVVEESVVSTVAGEDGATATEEAQPEPRGEFPQLPEGAVPANESAKNNEPAGNFNNVWRDQTQTSESFAVNVREEYVRHYLDTNEFNAVITVFSPVTGRNYQMDCKDNGQFVTCTGGDNAVVYIA